MIDPCYKHCMCVSRPAWSKNNNFLPLVIPTVRERSYSSKTNKKQKKIKAYKSPYINIHARESIRSEIK